MTLYWLARRLRNSLEPPEQPDAASERRSHLVGRTRLATAVNRLSVLLSLARLIGEIRRGSPRPAGRAVRCFWGVCRRCDRRYLARCWFDPQRVPGCVTRLQPLHSSCISPLSHVPTPPDNLGNGHVTHALSGCYREEYVDHRNHTTLSITTPELGHTQEYRVMSGWPSAVCAIAYFPFCRRETAVRVPNALVQCSSVAQRFRPVFNDVAHRATVARQRTSHRTTGTAKATRGHAKLLSRSSLCRRGGPRRPCVTVSPLRAPRACNAVRCGVTGTG